MTIFSNSIKVNDVTVKSTQPAYSNKSWTGQRIIRSTGIQYYEIAFTLTFNMSARSEVDAFIASYSQGKPFTLSLGHMGVYQGNQTAALSSTAIVAKGNLVIPTNVNIMAVGELVQFTNHKKLYRIIDRTDNSITIFPALQNTVQNGEIITYNNLMIEAVLNPDNDYSMSVQTISSIQLKAMENII